MNPPAKTPISLWVVKLSIAVFALAVLVSVASVQPAFADDEAKELPKPVEMTLPTKDGVQLKCTFFPGTNGKQTVPVMLIHGWKGRRGEFLPLAQHLQKLGHAVMIPDLRGHGESTVRKIPGRPEQDVDVEGLTSNDFALMYGTDIETTKSYLMKQNNEGELNIELLCIVGADLGSILALNWCVQDWSWRDLPAYKQGKDVKAFVLLSPQQSFRTLRIQSALNHPIVRRDLSAMIMVGINDSKAKQNATRLHASLKRFHAPVPRDPELRRKKQKLFLVGLQTSLQGTKLLNARGLDAADRISQFIDLRVVRFQEDLPWQDRTGPFGG